MEEATPNHGFLLSSKLYLRLKGFALLFLPAVAACYFGLSWFGHQPAVTAVLGVISILELLLGMILAISSDNYNRMEFDGRIIKNSTPQGGRSYLLDLNVDPEDVADMTIVRFKIVEGSVVEA